jgi:hypothetical protein
MQKDSLQRKLSIPDGVSAGQHCLCEGVNAPNLTTVKDFLHFHIATSRGKIVEETTVDLVNTFAEWFFAGFTRITGTLTDEEDMSEVCNIGALS